MILNNNFYTLSYINAESNAVKATIEINQHHGIFNGHFPGQPVVPGAGMLQIVKEIAEMVIDRNLQLTQAVDVKFLLMINPIENSTLQLLLNYGFRESDNVNVTATLLKETSVCFKFRGMFKMV